MDQNTVKNISNQITNRAKYKKQGSRSASKSPNGTYLLKKSIVTIKNVYIYNNRN